MMLEDIVVVMFGDGCVDEMKLRWCEWGWEGFGVVVDVGWCVCCLEVDVEGSEKRDERVGEFGVVVLMVKLENDIWLVVF